MEVNLHKSCQNNCLNVSPMRDFAEGVTASENQARIMYGRCTPGSIACSGATKERGGELSCNARLVRRSRVPGQPKFVEVEVCPTGDIEQVPGWKPSASKR